MLPILAECKASACKSLQGLYSFPTEGSRAFEDIESFVHQLSELGLGKESHAFDTQSLKSAKRYLESRTRFQGVKKVSEEGMTGTKSLGGVRQIHVGDVFQS